MYWKLVLILATAALTGASASYLQSLLAFPPMQEWAAEAAAEREVIEMSSPPSIRQA